MKNLGVLYGLGMGPGDPDLVTVKTARLLASMRTVYCAASDKNSYSLALDVARPHLQAGATVRRLPFPMSRDGSALQQAWKKNAHTVLDTLLTGEDTAFLTLGDPITYSTFGYLMQAVTELEPRLSVEIVPGVSAIHAAPSLAREILVKGEETLAVVSGALGGERLRAACRTAHTVVVLKAYRNLDHIIETLEEMHLLPRAFLVSGYGMPDQTLHRDLASLKGKKVPYFSLIVVRREEEDVL